ncbi:bifunctional hydroxymethylpyrimidine kinase/phosphomethylpyrimidine kinase [Trueperella pecoris]|uniref:Bifunctional hydroxymethylpyrimidine kinase/phosphomethylpyrimidine kinase n=1 Tax=Trueperella pecoris TaxID=2733571 RepID=A0A7M1QS47_9ACTO|nr:bifunctional hydroxymethylpyrimidine kinase/phosphomethylpyrimidine kinase [Trueperella pecoris]QOQ38529.1 bifunctional hydroxymethylpyrimidine kinase/phosphomethylpyrimidine kinase [Trueperella pecoris]QOR44982.1 bifunctional hydroxymethylpyrimidine kinase/phosphomethylpyrimidine kinase [Trueperella pecoris]
MAPLHPAPIHPILAARPARVLSIAGSDPSGGAGIQADLKSITAAGGYGMAVITALTAQNTQGVSDVHTPDPAFLTAQLRAVSSDVVIDSVKTGMLATAEIIAAVSDWCEENSPKVLVVDPVMVATSGDRLLDPDAEAEMRAFARRATVVTPNIGELAVLVGQEPARTADVALAQARRWASETGVAVIVKTGHLTNSPVATNYAVLPDGTTHAAPAARLATTNTHGTGCSLSSALATRLGSGDPLPVALTWATDWLNEAINHGAALEVGQGNGPVDHSYRARRLASAANTRPWFAQLPSELNAPEDLPQTANAPAPTASQAAGPWTRALWNAGWQTWDAIARCGFVRGLTAGSLPEEQFRFYLGQDALYLADYSRALAALGSRALNADDGVFWAQSAIGAIVGERELHTTWLGGVFPGEEGPVTSHYTSFLLASVLGEQYAVGVAAVLPCFWLYAETGALVPDVGEDHPYAAWLRTYGAPEFAEEAEHAIALVERAMEAASPADRSRAARAFLFACRHELEFFEQSTRLASESSQQ